MASDDKNAIPKDPITTKSLLWPIFASTILLILTTVWAFYDEAVTRRPWKQYQREWLEVARRAYEAKLPAAEADEASLRRSEGYLALQAQIAASEAEIKDELQTIQDRLDKVLAPQIATLDYPLREIKSLSNQEKYRVEMGHSKEEKAQRMRALEELRARKSSLRFGEQTVQWNFAEMSQAFQNLKDEQGRLQAEMGRLRGPIDDLRKQLAVYVDDHRRGDDPKSVRTLIASLDTFEVEIKQIHIKTGDLVERCESCHLGIGSPVKLDLSDVQGRREFTSHNLTDRARRMVQIHEPETFGCTPCHNGNGVAVDSAEKGHGKYKHWLWPMYDRENVESGCVQCHGGDLYLDGAEGYAADATGFNKGKWFFKQRGCASCHRYEGFDKEALVQKTVSQELEAVAQRLKTVDRETAEAQAVADAAGSSEAAIEAAYAAVGRGAQERHILSEQLVALEAQFEQIDLEVKKTGPRLAAIKSKLKPEWLQPWLKDPRAFRPDTRMPQFRLSDEQAWSIASYLWQASEQPEMAAREEGDVERGEYLFKTRGCLACHQAYLTEDDRVLPALPTGERAFAANLSRMGEKAERDYLAAWIQDPKSLNKHTAMPSLRLSTEDANHISAWLVSRKDANARYGERDEALKVLNDPRRYERGKVLIQHFGCTACHEIPGLASGGYPGTELTVEGSKPIERLDFGHYTHEAKLGHWYDHKGFFERKLANPAVWDNGKLIESEFDALKMPNPNLTSSEIQAITTFLLGSVESAVPASMRFVPEGRQRDLQEGWWVVKKYNCQGCHQFTPSDKPTLWTLPWYTDAIEGVPDKNGRPPTLVGEGTRVNPEWLSRFLDNPALTADPEQWHRNGVRQGMMVRMPTYALSENERSKLVRYFLALSGVPSSYVKPAHTQLNSDELTAARAVFVAADCANCHPLGIEPLANINPDTTYAPSFEPVSDRIRRDWIFRWVAEPQTVIPGTAMPAKFRRDGERWVVDGISGAGLKRLTEQEKALLESWTGDHIRLLQRYFGQWTKEESEFHAKKLEIR